MCVFVWNKRNHACMCICIWCKYTYIYIYVCVKHANQFWWSDVIYLVVYTLGTNTLFVWLQCMSSMYIQHIQSGEKANKRRHQVCKVNQSYANARMHSLATGFPSSFEGSVVGNECCQPCTTRLSISLLISLPIFARGYLGISWDLGLSVFPWPCQRCCPISALRAPFKVARITSWIQRLTRTTGIRIQVELQQLAQIINLRYVFFKKFHNYS